MNYKLLIVAFLWGMTSLWAQEPSKAKEKKAQKAYDDLAYAQYVKLKGGEDLMTIDQGTLTKLGTSYRKLGDSKNAEKVYRRLIELEEDNALNHLYYAQALQSNGHYAKAGTHYQICHEQMKAKSEDGAYDQRGLRGYKACNQMEQFKARGKVTIRNVKEINSPKLDFSPMFYKDGVVFVSTRAPSSVEKQDEWLNDNCMDLYYAPLDGHKFETPRPFSDELNSKFHEGPLSFTDDEQKVFFTRNNFNNGKRGKSEDNITKLKIYSARMVKGIWKEIKELPFNSNNTDVCHPALSDDERVLIFSSSEGENSQGGMDLYVSYWVGNAWSAPENLGPEINTAGNEIFPYLHHDGKLYFASNGHQGLGGLDLFTASPTGNDEQASWGAPQNIGAPFNSSHDDFGFIINREEKRGYFTSNRKGGKGSDDIYEFTITESLKKLTPKPLLPLEICVYDKKTNERIEGAKVAIRSTKNNPENQLSTAKENNLVVSLVPVRDGENQYAIRVDNMNDKGLPKGQKEAYTTDDNGTFLYSMYGGERYVLEAEKEGYIIAKQELLMPANGDLEAFCIGLEKRDDPAAAILGPDGKPLSSDAPYVTGIVLNKEYNRPLPGSEVTLLNRCTGDETTVTINETGMFGFPLDCGCDYVVKARKDKFIGSNKIISLIDKNNCKTPVKAELLLTPGFDKLGEPIVIAGKSITESLKLGDVIELKNIFYDFDQYYIRDDAAPDLDELVLLMYQFPSMEVELSAHTDSRGTKEYNEKLSANRVKAAKEYLVRKGVDENRIKAVGYGESRLRNNCQDGSNCSEYEHQRNRRTEVLITKFDEQEYIKVYYGNNEPTKVDPKR